MGSYSNIEQSWAFVMPDNVIEFNKAIKFKDQLKETDVEDELFDILDSLLDHVEDVVDHGIVIVVKDSKLLSGSTQLHKAQITEMLELTMKDLQGVEE